MFQASNFSASVSVPTVPAVPATDNRDDWRDCATLADLADLYAKGEVAQTWATSQFWRAFPQCAGCPEEVTAVFIKENLLPPELLTRKLDGEKLEFSPRSLESGLQRGTLKVETCNDGVPRVLWKGVLLDYGPATFWVRLTNAARKAAEKAKKEEGTAGTSRKETRREQELRARAEKAEAAMAAKDALAAEAAQQAAEFTARVRKLVHQLVEASTAAPGKDSEYNGAAMALLNLLP